MLAVDRSPAACAWASFNIQRLGLTQKIQVEEGAQGIFIAGIGIAKKTWGCVCSIRVMRCR